METQTHHYRLSYRDWIASMRFGRRRSPWLMFRFALRWLSLALLLWPLLALLWGGVHGIPPSADDETGAAVLTLIFAAFVFFWPLRLKKAYKKTAHVRHSEGMALAFNDEYFVCGLPGRSEGRFLWPALYDFAENDRVALIYLSRKRFVAVPKHAMPESSWDELRNRVPRRKA